MKYFQDIINNITQISLLEMQLKCTAKKYSKKNSELCRFTKKWSLKFLDCVIMTPSLHRFINKRITISWGITDFLVSVGKILIRRKHVILKVLSIESYLM